VRVVTPVEQRESNTLVILSAKQSKISAVDIPAHIKARARKGAKGRRRKNNTKQRNKAQEIASRNYDTESDESSDSSSGEWFSGGSDDERAYAKGNYAKIDFGDSLNDRYVVQKRLGWGHFSMVWLATDKKVKKDHPHRYVALKVQKSAPDYQSAAKDEISFLDAVREKSNNTPYISQMLDTFVYYVTGKHYVMVLEVLGENLYTVLERYGNKGFPLGVVKKVAKDILMGLDVAHNQCEMVITDIKPENILVSRIHPIDMESVKLHREAALQRRLLRDVTKNQKLLEKGKLNKNQRKRLKAKLKKLKLKVSNMKRITKEDLVDSNKCSYEANPDQTMLDLTQHVGKSEEKTALSTPTAALTSPNSVPVTPQSTTSAVASKTPTPAPTPSTATEPEKATDKQTTASPQTKESEEKKDDPGKPPATNPTSTPTQKPADKVLPPMRALLTDLGTACWTKDQNTEALGTRQYRAPEAILRIPWGPPIDIWSTACLLAELSTGDFLFDPEEDSDDENDSRDEQHLALIQRVCGDYPDYMKTSSNGKRFFNSKGEFRHYDLRKRTLPFLLRRSSKKRMSKKQAVDLSDFLSPMLRPNPEDRATAKECLKHPWLIISDEEREECARWTPPTGDEAETEEYTESEESGSAYYEDDHDDGIDEGMEADDESEEEEVESEVEDDSEVQTAPDLVPLMPKLVVSDEKAEEKVDDTSRSDKPPTPTVKAPADIKDYPAFIVSEQLAHPGESVS